MDRYARFKIGTTNDNSRRFIELMKDGNTKRVILFATPISVPDDSSDSDLGDIGPVSNLPLMSACVEYWHPGEGNVGMVVDGLFLTAARMPRYGEVCAVLDEAEKLDKIYYSPERCGFTVCESVEDAFNEMQTYSLLPFTQESRAEYIALLGIQCEEETRALNPALARK